MEIITAFFWKCGGSCDLGSGYGVMMVNVWCSESPELGSWVFKVRNLDAYPPHPLHQNVSF